VVEMKDLDRDVDREFNRRTKQLGGDVGDIYEILAQIRDSTSRTEKRVDKMDERFDGVEKQLKNVHKRFGKVDSALKDLSFKQWQTTHRVEAIQTEVSAMSAIQEHHGNLLEAHGERFDGIDEKLEAHGAMLEAHGDQLGGIDGRLETVDGKLDTIIETLGSTGSGKSA
jgi:archaellum component FlaC